jgi:hypothetical protein
MAMKKQPPHRNLRGETTDVLECPVCRYRRTRYWPPTPRYCMGDVTISTHEHVEMVVIGHDATADDVSPPPVRS